MPSTLFRHATYHAELKMDLSTFAAALRPRRPLFPARQAIKRLQTAVPRCGHWASSAIVNAQLFSGCCFKELCPTNCSPSLARRDTALVVHILRASNLPTRVAEGPKGRNRSPNRNAGMWRFGGFPEVQSAS